MQIIYYGAPGTGKSYAVDELVNHLVLEIIRVLELHSIQSIRITICRTIAT